MPCKNGYRKSIEVSKKFYEEERRYRESPEWKYWQWLVDQVNKTEMGFSELSYKSKLYFSINLLLGEVFNGGFDQYFLIVLPTICLMQSMA
ncbi:hypothetical protein [Acinetobacter sp. NIPH 2699]|uniref:hypothetical protein n=1 Tax=Acinetobacter sp. NIPH 2699 TaxID=2923433 RepID=UPI001F4A791C|nr:hypothetical protein [Acinetobacter sp. NIPH 2699]MCH7335594.1 hypothetical protein [Acinetobacter sp. NIPH 2699]